MLKNFVLLAVASIVSLALAEYVLRTFYPIGSSVHELDSRLLFKHKPDARKIYIRQQGKDVTRVEVSINSQGFRGKEIAPKTSRPRIVVYGDSFIAAEYSPLEETFVYQLQKALAVRTGRDYETINAGVSAYGPDQISLKMEDELANLRPDAIVVSVYAGNDFGDLMRNKIFGLDANGNLVRNVYQLDSSLTNLASEVKELNLYRVLKDQAKRVRQHWRGGGDDQGMEHNAQFFGQWLKESQQEYRDYVIQGNNFVTNLVGDHYDADISLLPKSESAHFKVRLMESVLRRIREQAVQAGVPMMLLIVPSPIDVADNYDWSVDLKTYPEYQRSRLTDLLEDIASRNDLLWLNLYDSYRAQDANSLYYHFGNDHWNADGQRLAADLVARMLIERGIVSP